MQTNELGAERISLSAERISMSRRALLSTLGLFAAGALVGCSGGALSGFELIERAQELASRMHLALNQAADASNRAVLAELEDAAREAAAEAVQARGAVRADGLALAGLLSGVGFPDERAQLERFNEHFERYEALDTDLLTLAVQTFELARPRQSADVWSLALLLGDERAAMVACEVALAALIELLAARWIGPTR